MSKAKETFDQAILDAENLLAHFNTLNTHPPPAEIEVLKRAGLVMAMTAWETYVEDRLVEVCEDRLATVTNTWSVDFVRGKLAEEIKRLHNPNSQKTAELFREYAGIDVTASWSWPPYGPKDVCVKLDEYIKMRGDVVHRARDISSGPPQAHPVTKADLEKAIRFFRKLVEATEAELAN